MLLLRSLIAATALIPAALAQQQPTPDAMAPAVTKAFASVMQKNPATGKLMRPVFGKSHGCVKARFDLNLQLDPRLQAGVFTPSNPTSPKSYPAWIRFSNDGSPGADNIFNGNPAENPNRGMSIKLVGVAGTKILEGATDAPTQDFVMQNHPIFFLDTAKDFLDLIQKRDFVQTHPVTQHVMGEMGRKQVANPLHTRYWTPTPYRYGSTTYKYFVRPCSQTPHPDQRTMTGPNFLHDNMARQLARTGACMDFFGQFFVNEQMTPLDRATVLWDESVTEPILLARITIPAQNIDTPTRIARCESLSFTGWHALPEHTPEGTLNQMRRSVYLEISKIRGAAPEPTQILDNE